MTLYQHNLLSINSLARSDIDRLIREAQHFSVANPIDVFKPSPQIAGLLFFQPSTRTRVGLQAAAHRLGLQTAVLSEHKHTATMSASESLEDTVAALEGYFDVLCLRHHDPTVFDRLCALTRVPILNCGNGQDEHPVQALIDLFAMQHILDHIDGLHITVVGDLRHMRTAHSLVIALSRFNNIRLRCVSPPQLTLPNTFQTTFLSSANNLEETTELDLSSSDVVYVAGLPSVSPLGTLIEETRRKYQLSLELVNTLDPPPLILCPLPRIDEITYDVNSHPAAQYFFQSRLGLYMRMAVLAEMLGLPGLLPT
jgi:aspartate carbamoyltransferase catalytic subunit